MKSAGIGGVEINPIAFPEEADHTTPSLLWLSPEWVENVKIAMRGAEERGMVCDIICGTGWPFGGEFLDRKDQSQLLTLAQRKVEGSQRLEIKSQDLINEALPQISSPNKYLSGEIYSISLVPLKMNSLSSIHHIDCKKEDEIISVDVPEGEYVLHALVKFTGFQAVVNGAPGASGPVLNHYDEKSVKSYLDRMSSGLFPALNGLENFRAVFFDGLELEGANWCDDFPSEFKSRRGYDIVPYLPFILNKVGVMGNSIGRKIEVEFSHRMKEMINRVRYDFTVTCMELVQERFLKTFVEWGHHHGLQSRAQAYGRELHPLNASLLVDIPEAETWLRHEDRKTDFDFVTSPASTDINKFVSSAAHFSGRRMIGAEEMTNTNLVFNASLERIKITGDQSVLSGMTHSILHGFNYSPPDAPFPGWIRYGTFFSEVNPWWTYFEQWATYKARISAVLQNSDYFADIAILHPLADMWSLYGPQRDPFPEIHYPYYQYRVWEAVHQNGNGCDYISEDIIRQSECKNGFLNYSDRKYHTLILLKVESLMPETAERLLEFVKHGGKIIFVESEPCKSPGLKNYEANDRKVKQAVATMKEKYPSRIYFVDAPYRNVSLWYKIMQKECDIQPYVKLESSNSFVSQIRHQTKDKDIYFLSNCSMDNTVSFTATFPHKGKDAWLWDPETGKRYLYPSNRGGVLDIELEPAGSKLIIFEKNKIKGEALPELSPKSAKPFHLRGWRVTLEHMDGKTMQWETDDLPDWSATPETRSFAGKLIYEKKVENIGAFHYIDLGKVYGVSEVWINGQKLGCKWYGGHSYPIPESLNKDSIFDIKIIIITTMGNYMKAFSENKTGQQWTFYQHWQPMGMLGPVRLL